MDEKKTRQALETMKPDATFTCPECGLLVAIQADPAILAHPLPYCGRFMRVETKEDATAYMREARTKGTN